MLKNFDITGTRTKDTGIWINNEKIAAIGIQIQRHVTSHGLSLNCDTNLAWFDNIVPCGLKGLGVTSITNQLNAKVDVQQALPLMMASMEEAFSMKFEPMTANIDTMINDFISKPGEY